MSTFIKRFQVTGYINSGDDKIFINALESDIPNGSILLIGSTLINSEQKKSIEYNLDGSFSLETSLNNNYAVGTFVDLIALPPENFLPPETPCKISFDGEDIYNFSVGLDRTYTITFSSGEAFNQFEFINHGEHKVTKLYPHIILQPSPLGPQSFQYKTHRRIGSVTIDENCNLCPNLNFEVFKTSDSINYFHEVTKYLSGCGTSTLSKTILDVQVVDCSCDYHTFLVIYCCDLSKDVDNKLCGISWTFDCSGEHEISPPQVSCLAPESIFDSWYYSNEDLKLKYHRKSGICADGCSAQDVNPVFLISPQNPTSNEIDLCSSTALSSTPLPPVSEITNPVPSFLPRNSDGSFLKTHLAGDEPHYTRECCLLAGSEVLQKPNTTDLNHRVFYKETSNGYFYETFDLLGFSETNFTEINNKKYSFKSLEEGQTYRDFASEENSLIAYLFSLISVNFGGKVSDYNQFVSIVDYSSKPDPINTNDSSLIRDESLFYKIFDKSNYSEGINDSIICQLNWIYWFSTLPSSIYGKNNWWLGLEKQHMPSFEIIQDASDSTQSEFSFEFNQTKVYPSFNQGKFLSDNFSLVQVKKQSNQGSQSTFLDNIYDRNMPVSSEFVDLIINYYFNPDPTKISSQYSSISYPIIRKEKIRVFLKPSNHEKFPSLYALDKTKGIKNPVFKLIQGLSNRYIV